MRAVRALALAIAVAPLAPLVPGAAAADLGGRDRIADPPPVTDMPAPFSWAGLYVGAHFGYGLSDVEWEDGAFSRSHEGEGGLAGGQLGYNLQSGRLVYGLEADISSSWVEGDTGCCGHSVELLYSARGRAGLASDDNRWLFYLTGGAAWADVDYVSAIFGGHSDTHFGWVAGGGIERALTPNMIARVEYLYYDFESLGAPAGAVGLTETDLDPSMHTVRLGLNFKF